MKTQIKLASLLGICFLSSCVIKDYVSQTKTYLLNSSGHIIEVMPYNGNAVATVDYKKLSPNERIVVYEEAPWGRTIDPSWGSLLTFYDSVIVVYDGLYRVKHNAFNDTTTCRTCLSAHDRRNLNNDLSYNKVLEEENKNYLKGYYEYTFTEADYEFAKD